MKTKVYENDLIQMISEQTGQNKEIVAAFIATQLEEIEKLLNKTSSANVEGLGVFRVMKTAAKNKILFIPGFDALDEVKQNIYDSRMNGSSTSTSTLSDDFEAMGQNEDRTEERAAENGYSKLEIKSDADLPQREDGEAIADPYSAWDDFYSKNNKKYNWGTAILLIVAIALVGIIVATIL